MRRIRSVVMTLLVIASGLTLRRVPLGLPVAVVKYGGSMLWAVMLYGLFAAVWPGSSPRRLACWAGAAAAAVECFKLVHAPELDAFRRTLGKRPVWTVCTW